MRLAGHPMDIRRTTSKPQPSLIPALALPTCTACPPAFALLPRSKCTCTPSGALVLVFPLCTETPPAHLHLTSPPSPDAHAHSPPSSSPRSPYATTRTSVRRQQRWDNNNRAIATVTIRQRVRDGRLAPSLQPRQVLTH